MLKEAKRQTRQTEEELGLTVLHESEALELLAALEGVAVNAESVRVTKVARRDRQRQLKRLERENRGGSMAERILRRIAG
jgi:hypothetical protein